MTGTSLQFPPERWYCPNCRAESVIPHRAAPHVQFHTCPKLAMISAPMVRQGTRAKVIRHDREDYVGHEHVQKDANGRPIMAVETVRDEGTDRVVYAPLAHGRAGIDIDDASIPELEDALARRRSALASRKAGSN